MTGRRSISSQSVAFNNATTFYPEELKEEMSSNSITPELFNVGQVNSFGGSSVETPCQICGDKATGRHYGAMSCDGCKGFFRRSIRKRQSYQCRQQKMCSVEMDKRNQCRYCRLQKCIRIGMKQEAVQSERDKISSRSTPARNQTPTPSQVNLAQQQQQQQKVEQVSMLSLILNAELVFHQHFHPPSSPLGVSVETQEAGVDELLNSMKEQVLLLVQWAKRIPQFMQLAVDDQICLLKAHASEHLLLGVTRRSRNQSFLLLGNNYIVSRQSPENSFALIAGRVLDQLLVAFRTINVDDTEYACLKAIVFFDPYADGLQAREPVFILRQEVILALYTHIRNNCGGMPRFDGPTGVREPVSNSQSRASSPRIASAIGTAATSDLLSDFAVVKRFGELLLLVPSVRSIAEDMVDHIKFYKLFGAAKVDNVLHELLLGDTATDDNIPPVHPNMSSAHNSQPPSYPSSGATTPALCVGPQLAGPSTSDMYVTSMINQSSFPANSSSSSPADQSFDASSTQGSGVVNNNPYPASFSVLDPGIIQQSALSLMTPHHLSGMNGSPLTQSPGLSTLAAAAFAMANPNVASFSNTSGFLSPPADQYHHSGDRLESPSILSFAFSNRTSIPINPNLTNRRASQQPSPVSGIIGSGQTVAMKPEQMD